MADELTKLLQMRKTQRALTTRTIGNLQNLCLSDDDVMLDTVTSRLAKLTTILEDYDSKIRELQTEDQIVADIDKCEDYQLNAGKQITIARKRLSELQATQDNLHAQSPQNTSHLSTSYSNQPTVTPKLPRLEIKPFCGQIEDWPRFSAQFDSAIDCNTMVATIDKHLYLWNLVEDEARDLIAGLKPSAENYPIALEALKKRYGNKKALHQAHFDFFREGRKLQNPNTSDLRKVFNTCQTHLNALNGLNVPTDHLGAMISPDILRLFPEAAREEWFRTASEDEETDLEGVMHFLDFWIRGKEKSEKLTRPQKEDDGEEDEWNTASALHNKTKATKPKGTSTSTTKPPKPSEGKQFKPRCYFCDRDGHWSQDCKTITDLSQRRKKLQEDKRCFICLWKNHIANNCRSVGRLKCRICQSKKHHTAICDDVKTPSTEAIVHLTEDIKPTYQELYQQTAVVWIRGPKGDRLLTKVLLDTGSDRSFISSDLITSLKLPVVSKEDIIVSTLEQVGQRSNRQCVKFHLESYDGGNVFKVEALETTHRFKTAKPIPLDICNRFKKLQFADAVPESNKLQIELLIGLDFYEKIFEDSIIRVNETMVIRKSKLGWILSGNRPGAKVQHVTANFVDTFVENQPSTETLLRRFWDLESIGITAEEQPKFSSHDQKILDKFSDTFTKRDDRAVVSLPWKSTAYTLTDNFLNADKRFTSLQQKFNKNPEFEERYTEAMKKYFVNNHVETVDEDIPNRKTIYYLPHHAIIDDERETTKVRIVFDASSHDYHSPSLNTVLEQGPDLNPDSTSVLLRYRTYQITLAADGSQSFLQLILSEQDRDATRFLWFKTTPTEQEEITFTKDTGVYRFTRLPFGLNCSPYLLAATLREYATVRDKEYPGLKNMLDHQMYADDLLTGDDTEDKAKLLYHNFKDFTNEICLPLTKWMSNSSKMIAYWENLHEVTRKETTVLGIAMDAAKDEIFFKPEKILRETLDQPLTKRTLLRTTARVYDPLGLLTPLTVRGKILFQKTWARGLDWDDLLPNDIADLWTQWKEDIRQLATIKIPRWIHVLYHTSQHRELHVFCDASQKAYGTAIYLKTITGTDVACNLLISKGRIAPTHKITLPRLELLAATIGIRLWKYVDHELHFHIDRTIFWSDSTITLHWIKNEPSGWKPFISNRITEIHTVSDPNQWFHCPGQDNPADHLTRGLSVQQLRTSENWWKGPKWITKDEHEWPKLTIKVSTGDADIKKELRKQCTTTLAVDVHTYKFLDIERINNYHKILRITAYVLRFVGKLKHNSYHSDILTLDEIDKAKQTWICLIQKELFGQEKEALCIGQPLPKDSLIKKYSPYLDENNLLRVGGRLHFADLTEQEKHPLILHGKHHYTRLLIRDTHLQHHHMGVKVVLTKLREQYWILHGRRAVKSVLNQCLPCKKWCTRSGANIEAPLPLDRLKVGSPFQTTGIDFAGPLYTKSNTTRNKRYIALFTCAVTRAIHLELVSDMSTPRFIDALTRFISRRGLCETIYTDNAKTFKSTAKEFKALWHKIDESRVNTFLLGKGISWKFIVEHAAWWGGFWERMVQTTKRCLRKTLGSTRLDDEQLTTVLTGIEATINSRPITYLYEEPMEETPLTPNHFLTGGKITFIPKHKYDQPQPKKEILSKLWKMQQQLQEHFWNRWKKEYLLELRNFHEVQNQKTGTSHFRIGDLAILEDKRYPRQTWKMTRIVRLVTGRDGKIRSCEVKDTNGVILKRPIQLVHPLELLPEVQGGEDVGNMERRAPLEVHP